MDSVIHVLDDDAEPPNGGTYRCRDRRAVKRIVAGAFREDHASTLRLRLKLKSSLPSTSPERLTSLLNDMFKRTDPKSCNSGARKHWGTALHHFQLLCAAPQRGLGDFNEADTGVPRDERGD